jgi:hypothetical protein
MSGHIAERAGFIATLPPSDPERRQAEEHVRSCTPCREAMAEGDRLTVLLAEAVPLAPPTPEALTRAAAVIARETQLERRNRRILHGTTIGVLMAVWVAQVFYGKKIAHDTASLVTSLAVLATGLIGVALVDGWRRFVLAGVLAVSGAFALAVGRAAPLEPRFGIECLACELVAGVILWLTVTVVIRWRATPFDVVRKTAVVATGALASQAAQLLSCPVPHARAHLLMFHFGGVLIAAALGAVLPGDAAALVQIDP